MGTRYMDKRYDEVANLQAQAWKKVTEDANFDRVENTAEWMQARQIASEIAADEAAAAAAQKAADKAAKEAAKNGH